MKTLKIIVVVALAIVGVLPARPCSRVVFRSDSTDVVMVGRTLDWRTPIPTNIYVYPRGIDKASMPSGSRLTWTSKYASVLAVSYDGGVTEGMNEKGLVMNGLFCNAAEYKVAVGNTMPVMSLAVMVSYFLDNFATVGETARWLDQNEFGLYGKTFDGGTTSLLHWALTDASGETLIMEYDRGRLRTYRGLKLQVLTNNPDYQQMLAIDDYWNSVGGANMLPGTVRSSDRFVRGSFFIRHIPDNVDVAQAWTSLSGIMGNLSVPSGYEIEGQPNLSTTQWRSISDVKRMRYYFKFADSMSDFYVDMGKVPISSGSPILKLDTSTHDGFFGCVNDLLKISDGFTPIW